MAWAIFHNLRRLFIVLQMDSNFNSFVQIASSTVSPWWLMAVALWCVLCLCRDNRIQANILYVVCWCIPWVVSNLLSKISSVPRCLGTAILGDLGFKSTTHAPSSISQNVLILILLCPWIIGNTWTKRNQREAFSDIDSESTKLVRQQLYILQHSYDLGI